MRYVGQDIKLIVNDLMVNYSDQGPDESPVIIFIHGFPLNKSMWDNQVELLKDNFRVITYDIRGHGESDAGNEAFTIDLFVLDLINLMNSLKIDKSSLCGLSMGGYIALNAIKNYPERIKSLVLCDTNCFADSAEAKEKRMKTVENIIKDGVNKYADLSIKNLFSIGSFSKMTAEIASVKEMIVNTSELALCSTLIALSSRLETCSKLVDINVPVLILVGKEDILSPPDAANIMHEKIKNSSLQVIENAGHLSNIENPDVFNQHLNAFFNSVYKEQLTIRNPGVNSIFKDLRDKLNVLFSFKSI